MATDTSRGDGSGPRIEIRPLDEMPPGQWEVFTAGFGRPQGQNYMPGRDVGKYVADLIREHDRGRGLASPPTSSGMTIEPFGAWSWVIDDGRPSRFQSGREAVLDQIALLMAEADRHREKAAGPSGKPPEDVAAPATRFHVEQVRRECQARMDRINDVNGQLMGRVRRLEKFIAGLRAVAEVTAQGDTKGG